jgi:hypothetical protein
VFFDVLCALLFDFCRETWLSMSGWFRVMCDWSLANWSRSVFSHTDQFFMWCNMSCIHILFIFYSYSIYSYHIYIYS